MAALMRPSDISAEGPFAWLGSDFVFTPLVTSHFRKGWGVALSVSAGPGLVALRTYESGTVSSSGKAFWRFAAAASATAALSLGSTGFALELSLGEQCIIGRDPVPFSTTLNFGVTWHLD